jgi:hypothetical protein
VPEQTVRSALNLKFREALLDMFSWEEGEFSFDAGTASEIEGVPVEVNLADVHREGEFRETAWQAIRSVFPRATCTCRWTRAGCRSRPRRAAWTRGW